MSKERITSYSNKTKTNHMEGSGDLIQTIEELRKDLIMDTKLGAYHRSMI